MPNKDTTEAVLSPEDAFRDTARIAAELIGAAGSTDPFAAVVRATRMPMIITNPNLPDNPIVFVNDSFCRLSGYERAEILNRNCRFLQCHETDAGAVALIREAIQAQRPIEIDILNKRKDGRLFWNRLLLAPVKDALGNLAYFFASQVDVTIERERLEGLESRNAALLAEVADRLRSQEASEARLQFATKAGRLGVWEFDLLTRELTTSPVFREMFGRSPTAPFTYEELEAAIHPEDRQPMHVAIAHSIATGADYDIEYRVMRLDGAEALVNVRAQIVRDADGKPLNIVGIALDITRRRKVERDLALSDESLRLSNDAAEIGTWDLDLTTDVLTWPDRTKAMFGISPGVSCSMADFYAGLHPDDRDHTAQAFASAIDPERRTTYDVEYRTIGKEDGVIRWIAAKGRGLFDDSGRCVRAIGTAIDITRRKLNEEALRTSEQQLRALNADLEQQVIERSRERGRTWQVSTDLLSVITPDGFFESTNPAWEVTLGWSMAEMARLPWFDLVHPDDLERSYAGFEQLRSNNPVLRFENRYRRKDASYRWLSWVAVPEGGKFYCSARDVTDQKNQEIALAKSNAERDRLWRTTQDLQVVIDTKGAFLNVNPAVTRILGWFADEMIGRSVFDFVIPEDEVSTEGALRHASDQALPVFENRYRHKDGGFRWISWVAAPEGDLIYASGRHVTAEKEQAIDLAAAQEALRQSQKMEAVGQLTGGLAHDFNNLLTGITGSLELLQTRVAQGRIKDVDRYVNAAQGAAKRAAALTHRLLAFSRRQTLDPKPTDLNRLVTGMEDLIGRTMGPEIDIEPVTGAGLWATLVDASQLENALLNLCINARDAMPQGGKLSIETANRWLDERAAKERDISPGQYVSLCVSDNGTGMPPGVIERAFDPFFTTKPIGQGTGLGLSMIYGFVRQSGGQVRIYSEVGKGTMVCLYLPRHLGPAETGEPVAKRPDAPQAEQGETVLVVDDEPTVRMLVTEILEDLGYTAIEAADGVAGLKILQSDVRIDLLVTDVGLPGGMNGRQLADAARVSRRDLKVLFITGYAENAVLSHGHLDSGMQVMTKPFAMEALAIRIKSLIDSQ